MIERFPAMPFSCLPLFDVAAPPADTPLPCFAAVFSLPLYFAAPRAFRWPPCYAAAFAASPIFRATAACLIVCADTFRCRHVAIYRLRCHAAAAISLMLTPRHYAGFSLRVIRFSRFSFSSATLIDYAAGLLMRYEEWQRCRLSLSRCAVQPCFRA